MLKNEYLLAKIGADTAENEPFEIETSERSFRQHPEDRVERAILEAE